MRKTNRIIAIVFLLGLFVCISINVALCDFRTRRSELDKENDA